MYLIWNEKRNFNWFNSNIFETIVRGKKKLNSSGAFNNNIPYFYSFYYEPPKGQTKLSQPNITKQISHICIFIVLILIMSLFACILSIVHQQCANYIIYNFKHWKFQQNIEKFECMEYNCDQIIPVIEFENLNMYFKSKVVDGILGWIFLWCMKLIYINQI
jgi:hypothetical protein